MISTYPLITLGSPFGIGYEIFLLSVSDSVFKDHIPYCIGSERILNLFKSLLKIDLKYKSISIDDFRKGSYNIDSGTKNFILINIDKKEYSISNIFCLDREIDGEIAYNTIKEAGLLVKDGFFKSITTLPVTKENINIIDKTFYGHTEFFQQLWEEKSVFMTFVSKRLNLLLLTTHIPLKDVSSHITEDVLINGINNAIDLKKRLELKNKICLLGLNPHAGENGLIGNEEFMFKNILKKYDSNEIEGPIPADTAFIPSNLEKYSIFIASYHDQGLIPFKMLAFDDGVNLSFGMKYIRTSVDHGTAVSLIGKKCASINSFINAYNTAIRLSK